MDNISKLRALLIEAADHLTDTDCRLRNLGYLQTGIDHDLLRRIDRLLEETRGN